MCLDVELISLEQVSRLNPFLKPTGVVAAMRIGDDRYFDPAQVAVGYAKAAAARGATLLPKTNVLAVNISAGKMTGVTTATGKIESPVIVDAARAWTRLVAEASGIRVPLVPTRVQLIITEPLGSAHASLPMVRIMDAAVYMRPCHGGLLWGVYEEAPRFFDMQSFGADFDIKDMPLDIEVLRSAAAEVKDQVPILQEAKVREFCGGIPTMTADGHHILGPAPGAEGFYFSSGCNVAGLAISPTIGETLATWIVDGKPPVDLSPMSCMGASKTSRGPRLNSSGMQLGNIGISMVRSELLDPALMMPNSCSFVIDTRYGSVPVSPWQSLYVRNGEGFRTPAGMR